MPSYNPYHFVPVFERTAAQKADDLPLDQLACSPRVTHDRYAPNTYSGQVECRVTARTAMFVGNQKTGDQVTGYTVGDRPAIPASSLRGMISHIAEAASESALRVLGRTTNEQPCYSFRRAAENALSAIGRLRKKGEAWMLEPVTLPQLPSDAGAIRLDGPNARWRQVFPTVR